MPSHNKSTFETLDCAEEFRGYNITKMAVSYGVDDHGDPGVGLMLSLFINKGKQVQAPIILSVEDAKALRDLLDEVLIHIAVKKKEDRDEYEALINTR